MSNNPQIPIADLAVVTPGNYDHVVVAQNGFARKALAPEVNAAAAALSGALDSLVADAEADIAPVIAGLGYEPPVAYAASIDLTSTRQTVEYLGQVYAPLQSALPFTTSGAFEAASFRLVQGVVGADLAAGTGAGMVGFQQSGTGAVARTLQDKGREVQISVLDYCSSAQRSDVVGRVGAIDVTTAINAALDYAESLNSRCEVRAPAGVYLISSTIRARRNVVLAGDGYDDTHGTVFKLANGANCTCFDTQTATFSQHHGFRDLVISGNKANQTPGNWHGISAFWWDAANVLTRVAVKDCRGSGVLFVNTGAGTGNARADSLICVRNDGGGIVADGQVNSLALKHCLAEGNGLNVAANYIFRNMNDISSVTLDSCRGEGRSLANGGAMQNILLENNNGALLNIIGGYYMGDATNILSEQIKITGSSSKVICHGTVWLNTVDLIVNDLVNARTLTRAVMTGRVVQWRWNCENMAVAAVSNGLLQRYVCAAGNEFSFSSNNSTPEGTISAKPGSVHYRTSGGAAGALYVKKSGTGATGWARVKVPFVATKGDVSSTLSVSADAPTQRWDSPLTANRTVTLPTSDVLTGDAFRILRTAAATGAYALNVGVGPLKALSPGQWCDVEYTGSAWAITAAGTL